MTRKERRVVTNNHIKIFRVVVSSASSEVNGNIKNVSSRRFAPYDSISEYGD